MNNTTCKEVWKPIPGWEDTYEVSSLGRVKSLARTVVRKDGITRKTKDRILSPWTSGPGYPQVSLKGNGRNSRHYVHELVMLAFVGPRPQGVEILHQDDCKTNNALSNLRYGTRRENLLDSVRNRHHHQSRKTHCKYGHALVKRNLTKCSQRTGNRACLACSRANAYCRAHEELKPHYQELSDSYYQKIMESS